ncbi:MAG: hypothetical protein ACXW0T_05110 [Methylobacter sp.]
MQIITIDGIDYDADMPPSGTGFATPSQTLEAVTKTNRPWETGGGFLM